MWFLLIACLHGTAPDADSPEALESAPVGRVAPVAPRDPPLTQRLQQTAAAVDAPRTRHRTADGRPTYTNRLVLETSPYLRQHAHNPVDWMPWGDEAFALAARLGRPVLLSVGYATCHWCHVMEEESFEDEAIAAYINANYVPIKVDREERPDVDAVYMAAVQAMQGRGGWPMTLFLTPDRRPYYAATYLPPRDGDRGRAVGFLTTLQKMKEAYDAEPERVAAVGSDVAERIRRMLESTPPPGDLPGPHLLEEATARIATTYDPDAGGRSGAPKFPSGLPIGWLLHEHRRTGADVPRAMALYTLGKMATGGLHDHAGGGFHRYTVDGRWQVPHFEKMLYDNALLARLAVDAWQLDRDPAWRRLAERTLRFMDRELSTPDGGFMSAIDADSPVPGTDRREEGWFYTWTPEEAQQAQVDAATQRALGITAAGDVDGRSILHLDRLSDADVYQEALEALFEARSARPRPLTDTKVVAAWNGLALTAYARAGRVLDAPQWTARAEALATHLMADLVTDARVARTFDAGRARHAGMLEDHAAIAAGLVELFESTADPRWLRHAMALDRTVQSTFTLPDGGFRRTPSDGEVLLAAERPTRDGAEPSGASIHVATLYRLAALTGDDGFRARADAALKSMASGLQRGAFDEALVAVDWRHSRVAEIVTVWPDAMAKDRVLADVVRDHAPRNHVQLTLTESQVAEVAAIAPIVAEKVARDGKPTVYVCEQGACLAPLTDPAALAEALKRW